MHKVDAVATSLHQIVADIQVDVPLPLNRTGIECRYQWRFATLEQL